MVEDEPRPSWNGSYTSSTSVCISSFTSNAILPQVPVTRPRKQPTSAMRSRTVCQEISGWPSLSSLHSSTCTFSPSLPSADSVPAAPPNSPTSTRGLSSARRCVWRSKAPSKVAIFFGECGQRVGDGVDLLLENVERFADLHDGGGVGDVLGGGAPVAPFAEPALAQLDELLDHREHRVADALGRLLELGHVDVLGVAVAHDLGGGVFRDDAELALRARQRRLEIEIFLHPVLVREHVPHRGRGENIAEHRGIEDRRGHSDLLRDGSGRRLAFPPVRSTGCAGPSFRPKLLEIVR